MDDFKEQIDQPLFEQIEAYLLNTMDTSERVQFEAAMVQDAQLRSEVDLQQHLIATVQTAFPADNTIRHLPMNKSTTPVRKMFFKWWMVAAALLLIAAAAWFYQSTKVSADKLFASYFYADPGLPVAMSSTSDYSFYDGMVSYKEGDYKRAIEIWTDLKDKGLITDTLQYYIGVAGLNRNDVKMAVHTLLPLTENKGSEWYNKVVWYLALAYLKSNNVPEALNWLKQLPDDRQAQSLFKDLQKD